MNYRELTPPTQSDNRQNLVLSHSGLARRSAVGSSRITGYSEVIHMPDKLANRRLIRY